VLEAKWERLTAGEGQPQAKEKSRMRQKAAAPLGPIFGDRVEHAFSLIAFLLSEVFGFEDVVLYEKPAVEDRLIANSSLPAPPFHEVPAEPIALDDQRLREVRVFRSGLYTVEIEGGDLLKIVVPLKGLDGHSVGVISIRSPQRVKESWATLFVRIPIVERSLNLLWRKLLRVEAEQAALLMQIADPDFIGRGGRGPRGIAIFVATKFGTDLHRHFKRKLNQFPNTLAVEFLEVRPGYIYDHLLNAMQERDPLVLVDISKINCNVFFELGLAIGLNRPGYPVIEGRHRILPELVKGLFHIDYSLTRPLGERFFAAIQRALLSYQKRRQDLGWVHMLAWDSALSVPPDEPYLVVIGQGDSDDDESFRSAVDAVARKHGLRVEVIWDANDQLRIKPDRGLVLWRIYALLLHARVVVARSENVETTTRASHFIAIGMAMGLEARRGTPHVLLCHGERSPEGLREESPSDLLGMESIPLGRKRLFSERLSELLAAGIAGPRGRAERKEARSKG